MSQGHLGPIQQFTECCLACGKNVYETSSCPAAEAEEEAARARLERRVAELEKRVARLESGGRQDTPPARVTCPVCNGTWMCSCF